MPDWRNGGTPDLGHVTVSRPQMFVLGLGTSALWTEQ